MNLRCKDCKVTFDSPYNKDCPFCGADAFVVELLHENKETEPDYWMIRGEIWSDDIAFLEAHNGTSSEVQAAMDEWENNAVPLYKSPVTTDKLSVEKLEPIGYYNEAHGFLHDEFDKDCYCQGGCSMEAVYTESQVKKLTDEKTVEKLQEQLNTMKAALIVVRADIEEHNQIYDLSVDTALLLEGIDGIAFDALAAIGGDDE